ncbi:MAG: RagB/SusD family nutrient uptake outer membrane protein, partial [Mucilaginibacter sp.]
GASNNDWNSFQQDPDEGINNQGAQGTSAVTFNKTRYTAFDYGLIRRINIFLAGIRSAASQKAMTPVENANFEGQALFLRAWTFFHMVKTLGGMTIVGDKVFSYVGSDDVVPLQLPRNSEIDCYRYILTQCDLAATKLTNPGSANGTIPAAQNVNGALANKWACKMLKARAALTAASIAKWNTPGDPLLNKTDKFGTVTHGIPAAKADTFYLAAYTAAKEVIDANVYSLMKGSGPTDVTGAQQAFSNAINIKAGNTEVIWTADRNIPGINTQWTNLVGPLTVADGSTGNALGATANLVEAFENRAAVGVGAQGIKTRTGANDVGGTMIMYDLSDPTNNPFMQKDIRLWATVIWPNALFKGVPIDLRAGEWTGNYNTDGSPKVSVVSPPAKGTTTPSITSINGPAENSSTTINKTGFIPRKWLDEKTGSGLGPNYSDMWVVRFRLAEAYTICGEAALLSPAIGQDGATFINVLRRRALLGDIPAGSLTFDEVVNECRVEFAFEDHRLWDMNRWRRSDQYWDGAANSHGTAFATQLYAYVVNIPGNPGGNNGKYIFDRKIAYRRRFIPFLFTRSEYYSDMSTSWLTNNPNWEKNPGQ